MFSEKHTFKCLVGVIAAGSMLLGCSEDNADSKTELDKQLDALIAQHEITGDPAAGRKLPSVGSEKAKLGKALFFSKSLGGELDTACVSCHHPALGGGDDLSLPIGVGADDHNMLGPGRTHSTGDKTPTVPRNSPTTYNIGLWDQVMFHDGRVESLGKTAGANGKDGLGIRTPDSEFGVADANAGVSLTSAQARFLVTSEAEMRGTTYAAGADNDALRGRLQARLQNTGDSINEINVDMDGDSLNNWVQQFEKVYTPTTPPEDIITFDRIADAIAAYENSQVFVDNPWKSYVEGDTNAISDAAKRGAIMFYTALEDGGAGCVACHSGDFFTDEQFHTVAVPQIGEGKGDGTDGHDDFGRMRETGLEEDKYAFRTASLLNIEHTGPYGHTGAHEDLTSVVKHYLNPTESIDDYFAPGGTCSTLSQLNTGETCEDISGGHAETNSRLALAKLVSEQEAGTSKLVNADLRERDVADIVSFLEALTDPCLENASCIGQWIPEGEGMIDGNQVNGVDANNNPLTVN